MSPDSLMGWGIVKSHDAMYSSWAGVDGEEVAATRVIWANPNPTSRGTHVKFALPERGRALVTVYDAGGRLVRTLADRVMPAGPHAVEWDGSDESAHPVASGVYFARLRAAGGVRSSAKVVVVR
jgi:flagellar hook assembly protein FlgD